MMQATEVASATTYQRCGAERAGKVCRNPAGKGTDHLGIGTCSLHLGSTGNHRKAAAYMSARQQLERLTLEPLTPEQYIDPIGALLHTVTTASLMEAACREKVMELESWVGPVYGITDRGDLYESGEEIRAAVRLHLDWHKQLISAAKACAAAKIDERVVKLHEAQGAMLKQAFDAYMTRMGYTPERMSEGRKVFAATFRELTPRLAGGS